MQILVTALEVALPLLYAGLVVYFGRTFFRTGTVEGRLRHAVPAAYGVLGLHALYIGAYTALRGHELVATAAELSSLISFTLLAVYVFAELRPSRETSGTGFFVAAVALVLQFISSVSISSESQIEVRSLLRDPVFNAHVTTSVFGYAALMLAAIYGGLYLLLYRAIQRNEFGAIFEHVPSLQRLERYGLRATTVGFVFLTLSIVLGAVLVSRFGVATDPSHILLDPKVLMTLLVWLVFGVTLLVRKIVRLEGRRLVLFWMSGFALTVISMTIVNAIGTQFHSFF